MIEPRELDLLVLGPGGEEGEGAQPVAALDGPLGDVGVLDARSRHRDDVPPEHAAPYLDSFGPDRVIFGSDWPVCLTGASYKEWVLALKQIIASRPLEAQKKLLHDNAVKFYKLPA